MSVSDNNSGLKGDAEQSAGHKSMGGQKSSHEDSRASEARSLIEKASTLLQHALNLLQTEPRSAPQKACGVDKNSGHPIVNGLVLVPRDQKLLRCISEKKSAMEVSLELGVALDTAKVYLSTLNGRAKRAGLTIPELVSMAVSAGIILPDDPKKSTPIKVEQKTHQSPPKSSDLEQIRIESTSLKQEKVRLEQAIEFKPYTEVKKKIIEETPEAVPDLPAGLIKTEQKAS